MIEFVLETDDEYHAKSVFRGGLYLSSHALMAFLECPADYWRRCSNMHESEDSSAYAFGRAAHCLLLEGAEAFNARFTNDYPVNPKTGKPFGVQTKAYEEWRDAQLANGKQVVTPSETRALMQMSESVIANADARDILDHGRPEVVHRSRYCGRECQVRADWIHNGADPTLLDLKTCADITRFPFDFEKYRYINQLSFYQKVIESSVNVRLSVSVLAVEKTLPYRSALYRIKQSDLDAAQRENEHAIHELRQCERDGYWPTRFEGIHTLDLPRRERKGTQP